MSCPLIYRFRRPDDNGVNPKRRTIRLLSVTTRREFPVSRRQRLPTPAYSVCSRDHSVRRQDG